MIKYVVKWRTAPNALAVKTQEVTATNELEALSQVRDENKGIGRRIYDTSVTPVPMALQVGPL